jgi:hypothetical protein
VRGYGGDNLVVYACTTTLSRREIIEKGIGVNGQGMMNLEIYTCVTNGVDGKEYRDWDCVDEQRMRGSLSHIQRKREVWIHIW